MELDYFTQMSQVDSLIYGITHIHGARYGGNLFAVTLIIII